MAGMLVAIVFAATLATAAVADDARAPIGVARMAPDGTLVLDLRAVSGGGAVGHGRFVYRPADRDYRMVVDHLGGIRPGETKPVPPWPDPPAK
ncbi:MAG: hypothetical protein AB7K86_16175 [Rhodospirillales bacterium]